MDEMEFYKKIVSELREKGLRVNETLNDVAQKIAFTYPWTKEDYKPTLFTLWDRVGPWETHDEGLPMEEWIKAARIVVENSSLREIVDTTILKVVIAKSGMAVAVFRKDGGIEIIRCSGTEEEYLKKVKETVRSETVVEEVKRRLSFFSHLKQKQPLFF
ncbi:MAG: hypothetical protein QXE92_00330 [Thermofilaceae archaeon]